MKFKLNKTYANILKQKIANRTIFDLKNQSIVTDHATFHEYLPVASVAGSFGNVSVKIIS